MNKQLVVGISVLLIVLGLGGCTYQQSSVEEEQNIETKIVGEWITRYSTPPQYKYIFYENGTLETIGEGSRNQRNWYMENKIYLYIYDDEGGVAKYWCEMTELPQRNDLLYLHVIYSSGYSFSLERIS